MKCAAILGARPSRSHPSASRRRNLCVLSFHHFVNAPRMPLMVQASDQSKRLVSQRKIPAQTANVASDNFGNCAQFFERGIALAPFNSANIAGGGIRRQREVLLGQPFDFARLSNPFTQELERSRSFQSRQGRSKRNFPSRHYSSDFVLGLSSGKPIIQTI
jgi:hypothetical protein